MKEFVVVRRYTTYFTQTLMATNLDEAIAEAEENGDWDLFEEDFETYGSEAL
jgi:hypothetical protein